MKSTLEISIKIEVSDQVVTAPVRVLINGEPVSCISRLRVDMDSDESLPAIEADFLRGISMDSLSPELRATVEGHFNALKDFPGIRARMPAPR